MFKIAINGFGRIGRHAFAVAHARSDMEIVAINDLADNTSLAHLLQYDTAYPERGLAVQATEKGLIIDGKEIPVFSQKNPAELPWGELHVDVVLECTGVFRTKEGAQLHRDAGAKKVIISAPAKEENVPTYVRGINCANYAGEAIINNASCTTNCTAPVMQVLEKNFGIEHALLTTIHSYTADQNLQDGPHKDLRRARAAAQNIVPTSTGAAIATAQVIPSLSGSFDGLAVRVPTITGSLSDINVLLKKETNKEELNEVFKEAEAGAFAGVLATTDKPLVSTDFIGNPHSSIVDLDLTMVVGGRLVKIIAWYDNEWGYANRLVEMAQIVASFEA